MRTLLVALTMLASVITKADTTSNKVSPLVLHSFEKTFTTAQEVAWTVTSDLYKAAFTFNGQYVTAFYNGDGNLVAVSRNITSNQLPIKLQTALKCSYENYWITDLFEVSTDEGTMYYVTVENADNKVVLKSSGSAYWSVYQKAQKL